MNSLAIQLPKRTRKYTLENLFERHQEIVRLKSLGYSNEKIAKNLEISPTTVSYTLASPISIGLRQEIQTRKNEQAATINERIASLSSEAVDYMQQVLAGDIETASPALRVKVCEAVLDRSGHAKVSVSHTTNLNAHLTAEEIAEIRERSLKAGRDAGVVASCD